ncbi:MAG: tRNA (adenosine(37)-N6)-threonylcarbamoyltransferase complex dimerization subunit type 1 TsaB [Clostridia bacterium]|nr:tRNA (adenosine(37)-N6)-threonylcarbamoyltransferase complex dimerization subunit type 1 TsaB [Clostridia bacterium]
MLTLGIDTSAVTASVALVSDGEVVSECSVTGALTHSEHLVPMINDVLVFAGLKISDVSLYAVNAGPGSFTGLRIGVSTVKGMAFSSLAPCAPVSTLEALAMRLVPYSAVLCPVMDARRNEFYNALFTVSDGSLVRLTPDRAISAADLEKEISGYEKVVVNGDGADKFLSLVSLPGVTRCDAALLRQNAVQTALIGERMKKENLTVSCDRLSPVYLRVPQAERVYNEKNNIL